jgi:hypothetical protein
MKTEWFKMRMSERRLNKLRLYAAIKDTTMTHVIEDLIDSLKIPEIDPSAESFGHATRTLGVKAERSRSLDKNEDTPLLR